MDPILLDAIEYNGGGINTLLNRGAVKSVQRGVISGTIGPGKPLKANISKVDIDKTLFWFDYKGDMQYGSGFSVSLNQNGESVDLNKSTYGEVGASLWWQVIEFY